MNIGLIGPGDIGSVIVRKLRDAGYSVKMANTRGPESLKELAAKTGAIPVLVDQVVQDVDILFIVVNQKSIPELPKGLLNKAKKETIVIDVGNYYPARDGRIDEIENGLVAQLIDRIGFDSVDAGTIAESWRQQPGSPVYCTNPTKEELQLWLKKVDRSSLATDRERALKAYYPTREADYPAQIKAHRSVLIKE